MSRGFKRDGQAIVKLPATNGSVGHPPSHVHAYITRLYKSMILHVKVA